MKKFFSFALLSLLMVPLTMMAQGTKGNTITFNANNSTLLFSDLPATNSHATYSCYLRHNQAPIQIINANPMATGNEVAALQSEVGTGTGFFANSHLANNMAFSTGGDYGVDFYNYAGNYQVVCFAIIAPKGYRFTEYWMSICSNKYAYSSIQRNNGSKGATIMRYNYDSGSNYRYTPCTGESLTFSSSGSNKEIFTHTLSNAENILYFRIDYGSTAAWATHMNELRVKYVIDGDVEASLPDSETGTQVHTGYINLGKLSSKTNAGDYYFNKTNVTDLEEVKIVAEDNTSQISVANGVINVSKGGTYWIESPAKFRISAAKVNFVLSDPTITYPENNTIESGEKYRISDGNGNYLNRSSGNGVTNGTNADNATLWTITEIEEGRYTIQAADGRFLILSSNWSLTTSQSQSDHYIWEYDPSNRRFSITNSTNGRNYGIKCTSSIFSTSWSAGRTDGNNTPATTLTFFKQTITANGYSATLYGTSATSSVGSDDLSASKTSASLTANDLNNDGVKFTVTGAAAFTVDLTMEPLDPNLQNLEFGYKSGTDVSPNMVSAAATNFQFNNGETIVIPMEQGVSNATTIFRNAFNESRINWYDGTATGLSNYYLVDSEYEINGSESTAPSDKVDADQAGTTKIEFSNIKTLTARGGTLKETEFNKTNAGYQAITLTTSSKTIYIYSADKPEYCIMTAVGKNKNTHVAYTFYDAKVQGYTVNEDPVVTVTGLYTSSLKRNNVKAGVSKVPNDNSTDTTHKFYGVTVKSNGTVGYLTSDKIVQSIKETMGELGELGGIYAGDVMRTILYVDMSSLKSISGGADSWREIMMGTGDNCLFFMPSNFSIAQAMPGGGIIAGGENGEAVTDITIHDQQPFFSPYNFRTSTHVAHYERTQTNNKPTVTKSTLVLPFTINLSEEGHPKPSSDSVNVNVTFWDLTGLEDGIQNSHDEDGTYIQGVTGKITATAASGSALANMPYYVTSTENDEKTSFKVEAQGVTFAKTELGDMISVSEDGNMTAHGSFNGLEMPDNDPDNPFLYWSKDYFWYSISETLKEDVKFLPYRAYYTTNTPLAKNGKFLLMFSEGGEATGIENEFSREHSSQGVYDLQGRKLNVTGDQLSTLSKGIYIVNGKKIFVK